MIAIVAAVALLWNPTLRANQPAGLSYNDDAMHVQAKKDSSAIVKIEPSRDDRQPVLRAQQFENGELKMKDVDARRLAAFMRDLNQRRDYDLSQHGGRPGPDNAYLTQWLQKTTDEFTKRGYTMDKHGDLRRRGEILATR